MYSVLLAVDANEQRAQSAVEFLTGLPGTEGDLEVTILNVFEKFEASGDGGFVQSEELYDETEFPDAVYIVKQALEDEGVAVTLERRHGDPAETIIAVADEIDSDSIALTRRKRSPTGKLLFGSVAQSVLLAAEMPVHVVM